MIITKKINKWNNIFKGPRFFLKTPNNLSNSRIELKKMDFNAISLYRRSHCSK
jgi:hypothetical protein